VRTNKILLSHVLVQLQVELLLHCICHPRQGGSSSGSAQLDLGLPLFFPHHACHPRQGGSSSGSAQLDLGAPLPSFFPHCTCHPWQRGSSSGSAQLDLRLPFFFPHHVCHPRQRGSSSGSAQLDLGAPLPSFFPPLRLPSLAAQFIPWLCPVGCGNALLICFLLPHHDGFGFTSVHALSLPTTRAFFMGCSWTRHSHLTFTD
jgi:hypothetical protein